MTLQFGGSSPMTAFVGSITTQQRSMQILSTVRSPLPTTNFATQLLPQLVASTTTTTRLHNAVNPITNVIQIIGGASATVAANTDILTPAALFTMLLLAIQYCAQPPLTRKYLDSRANKKGVTMVEEIVKFGISLCFFLGCGKLKLLSS